MQRFFPCTKIHDKVRFHPFRNTLLLIPFHFEDGAS
jgi:hypothetical protein